ESATRSPGTKFRFRCKEFTQLLRPWISAKWYMDPSSRTGGDHVTKSRRCLSLFVFQLGSVQWADRSGLRLWLAASRRAAPDHPHLAPTWRLHPPAPCGRRRLPDVEPRPAVAPRFPRRASRDFGSLSGRPDASGPDERV